MEQKAKVLVRKVNKPMNYREEIRHTAECAFQRAIIRGKKSIQDGHTVTWLDIELPVDISGNSRGRCLDLIGIDDKENYVICELKFRKNYRDNGNPEKAAKQLREYFDLIKLNHKAFGNDYHHANAKSINWENVAKGNTRLIVAANKAYWNSYLSKCRKGRTYDTKGIECYSVDIEEDIYVSQKATNETYIPNMPKEGLIWKKIR